MLGWILSRAKTFVSQSGQFWVNIRELGLIFRLQLHQKKTFRNFYAIPWHQKPTVLKMMF